jgi:hypothetical protein
MRRASWNLYFLNIWCHNWIVNTQSSQYAVLLMNVHYCLHTWVGWSSGNFVVLYSGGAWFESRPRYRLSWLEIFMVFFSPSKQVSGQHLKLGHERLLPNLLQCINQPAISMLYSLDTQRVVKCVFRVIIMLLHFENKQGSNHNIYYWKYLFRK